MRFKSCIFILLFFLSLLCNIYMLVILANMPSYKIGVLLRDVNVTDFSNGNKVFKLPKGINVRDDSPRGIASAGLFGRNRFTFSIIESGHDFIDYSSNISDSSEKALYYGNASN